MLIKSHRYFVFGRMVDGPLQRVQTASLAWLGLPLQH